MGKQKTVIMQGDIIDENKDEKTKKKKKKDKKKTAAATAEVIEDKQKKSAKTSSSTKATKDKQKKEVKTEKKAEKKSKKDKKKKKIVPKVKKRSEKYKQAQELIEKEKVYSIGEAINLLKKMPKGNFNPSVEIHIKLGIDLSQSDQKVRTQITFTHDIGKTKKILVFASGDKQKEAKKAGADFIGEDELVRKVEKGFSDFDIVISTPEMMSKVGRLGKYLGQKGLMPNPKSGTVTNNVEKLIKEIKGGKTEIKSDDYGIIHQVIGKLSLDDKKLEDNFKTLVEKINSSKTDKVKGEFIKNITLCSSQSPGIKIHRQ